MCVCVCVCVGGGGSNEKFRFVCYRLILQRWSYCFLRGGVQVRSIYVYLMETFSREYVWGNWYFYCYTHVIFQGGPGVTTYYI